MPPAAPRRPVVLRHHGDERVDDWYWLRDRDDPEVIAYLEAENAHTMAATAHLEALRAELFDEIKGRIKQTDESAPVPRREWEYVTRTVEGAQYAIHARRPRGGGPGGTEQVLLDENALAEGHGFFHVGGLAVSPGQALVAYSTDVSGGERFMLRIRDIEAGADLPDVVEDTYYGLAWSADEKWVFYTRPDEAMRPWQVWRHRLGTDPAADVLVHQEDDERFFVDVARTKSEAFVLIVSASKVTTEVRFLPAGDPEAEPRVVQPRIQGVEYHVDHHRSETGGDRFYVVTNEGGAEDFKLVRAPVARPGLEHWEEVVPHRPGTKLDDVEVFRSHLVLSERRDGLEHLHVLTLDWSGEVSGDHEVEMPEPVYSAWVGPNREYDSTVLRFEYTSLVTPRSAFDYDLATRSRTLVKQDEVLGGYEASQYETRRLWAPAADGVRVPISLLARRDTARDGSAPCLLYGYGSYEHSIDPTFSPLRLSLVDRGFVFAIAHVRGGGELGRHWYEDGKLLRKKNTFGDFVACAEHLVAEGWTAPERLVIRGGSAGGLLMGAVANMRPELFRAVVAEVPFVDCLTTILDPSLPLTVTEWEEWGNPLEDPEVYAYMKSYSPYDNVREQAYPWMLVTAGLNDPRVSYWEPAKWVAKLRACRTDGNPLLLKTEMGAGHMGPSGRYEAWKDEAFIYAFVLDAVGLASSPPKW